MKTIGVIPARFDSTRFPGKPLAEIAGKPMLQWVVEAAKKATSLERLMVATDDQRIADLCHTIEVQVVMTDSQLPTGSDRVWQAVKDLEVDVIVNIQGDEPLLEAATIDQLLLPFTDSTVEMATLGRDIHLQELKNENTAKIVTNQDGDAIYFSRLPIPYSRSRPESGVLPGVLKHIGMYAFRKDFLGKYCQHGPTEIEQLEALEQLRALYIGAKIRVVKVQDESWGVDTPEDIHKIEAILKKRGREFDG
jgi:3-deoxy-manno-octulosonate cytidylyltransferase (CMP-KDO synthetase)